MSYDIDYWHRWNRSSTKASSSKSEEENKSHKNSIAPKIQKKKLSNKNISNGGIAYSFGKSTTRDEIIKATSSESVMIGRDLELPFVCNGGAIGQATRLSYDSMGASSQQPGPGAYALANVSSVGKQPLSSKPSAPSFTFSQATSMNHSFNQSGVVAYDNGKSFAYTKANSEAFTFDKGSRFSKDDEESSGNAIFAAPGPGTYSVRDSVYQTNTGSTFGPSEGTSAYFRLQHDLAEERKNNSMRPIVYKSGFGFKCCKEDHIKYGMCASGTCSMRGTWERKASDDTIYMGNAKPVAHIILLSQVYADTSLEACKKLLNQADIRQVDDEGRNVLHVIALQEFSKPREQLRRVALVLKLKPTVCIDATDHEGNTFLHLAVSTDQVELVEDAIQREANPSIRNKMGETALDLAIKLDVNHRIFQCLRAKTMADEMRLELEQLNQETKRRMTQKR